MSLVPTSPHVEVPVPEFGGLSKDSGIREEIARIGQMHSYYDDDGRSAISPIHSPSRSKHVNNQKDNQKKPILRSRTREFYDAKSIDYIQKTQEPQAIAPYALPR